MGSSDSSKFYRGDKTWSNTLVGNFTISTADACIIQANAIRLQNKAGNNAQATNEPYVTCLIIGDGRYCSLEEYKDDRLSIHGAHGILLHPHITIDIYDATKTYSIGTIVWQNNDYYYCKTAISEAEAWNADHWTVFPVAQGNTWSYGGLMPVRNNVWNIGSSSYKWASMYATTFYGALSGNADTATTATNTNYLIQNTRMDYGWNGVNYFNLSASRSSSVKNNQTPYSSATWTHILRFNHANDQGYYTDLAIPFNGNSIWYRRINYGQLMNASYNSNTGWIQVLDAINYSDYACTLSTAQTISGAKTFTGNLLIGASGAGGKLNGSATNGGCNSILIGDDVWLGDVNAGGIMGMKSTGSNCGFYMYNSSGTDIGHLYFDGTNLVCNKTISGSITGNAATATTASYISTPNAAGYTTDVYGNFRHAGSAGSTTSNWNLQDYAGTSKFQFYWETGVLNATQVKNAVWNDYAECRIVDIEEPGYCVTETLSGKMTKTNKRLQAGCKIISDTYGTCMGETNIAKTPIAVAGRVLVYPYRNRNEYELGAAVCSAPNGTIDIMTREEIMMYPERIVGTVSEIPNYEIWHGGNQDGNNDIKVNGRIWIYVR